MKEKLKKQALALLIIMVTLVGFSGGVSALQTRESSIRVRVFVNGEGPMVVETKQLSVAAFLEEAGISYSDTSVFDPPLDAETQNDMRLDIKNEVSVNFIIDGNDQALTIKLFPTTVGGAVNKLTKATGKTYTYAGKTGLNIVSEGQTIEVTSRETKQTTDYREVPYSTITVENPDLINTETNVLSIGEAGREARVTTIEYSGGKEAGRDTTDWIRELAPVDRVIEVGTKVPEPPKPATPPAWSKQDIDVSALAYSKVFDMSATAYTNDFKSCGKHPGEKGFGITATGLLAQLGVVAVDPRVIPLHTKLYITGYGYAYAGDTGGAIKGNIVDLFFATPGEVDNYGRRKVQVFVLDDQDTDYFTINK